MGTASRSDENRGNRQLVLASTGFSLLYAVCVSFFYFTPLAARPDFSAQAFDNVLNPAMFLTGVALALLVKHVPAKRQAIIPAIGYLSLAAAVALLFAAGVAQAPPLPGRRGSRRRRHESGSPVLLCLTGRLRHAKHRLGLRHHVPCGHGPGHGVGPPAADGAARPAVGSPGGLGAVPGAAEPGRQSGKRSERRPEDGRPRQARPPQYVPRPRPRHFRAFHRVRHHRRRSSGGSRLARCRLGHFEGRRHRRSCGLHPVLRRRPAKLDHAPVQRRLRRARHGHSLPAVSAGQLHRGPQHLRGNRMETRDAVALLSRGHHLRPRPNAPTRGHRARLRAAATGIVHRPQYRARAPHRGRSRLRAHHRRRVLSAVPHPHGGVARERP